MSEMVVPSPDRSRVDDAKYKAIVQRRSRIR